MLTLDQDVSDYLEKETLFVVTGRVRSTTGGYVFAGVCLFRGDTYPDRVYVPWPGAYPGQWGYLPWLWINTLDREVPTLDVGHQSWQGAPTPAREYRTGVPTLTIEVPILASGVSTLAWGYPGWGLPWLRDTSLGWGYLPWTGAYLPWIGVPTLAGDIYLGLTQNRRYLHWTGGVPTLDRLCRG